MSHRLRLGRLLLAANVAVLFSAALIASQATFHYAQGEWTTPWQSDTAPQPSSVRAIPAALLIIAAHSFWESGDYAAMRITKTGVVALVSTGADGVC